jgi:hypothetical protein
MDQQENCARLFGHHDLPEAEMKKLAALQARTLRSNDSKPPETPTP